MEKNKFLPKNNKYNYYIFIEIIITVFYKFLQTSIIKLALLDFLVLCIWRGHNTGKIILIIFYMPKELCFGSVFSILVDTKFYGIK